MLSNTGPAGAVGNWKYSVFQDELILSDEAFKIWNTSFGKLPLKFRQFFEAIHREDRRAFINEQSDTVAGKRQMDIEIRIILQSGQVKWVHVKENLVVANVTGEGEREGTVEDITNRRYTMPGLFKDGMKYGGAFENNVDGILLTSIHGKVLVANPAACLLCNMPEDEICGMDWNELIDTSDKEGEPDSEKYPLKEKVRGEIILLRKGGEKIPVEFTSSAFTDSIGAEKICLILRDIGERKEAAQKALKVNRLCLFSSHINQMIIRADNKETLFKEACNIAVKYGHVDMAWIGLIDKATGKIIPVIHAGCDPDFFSTVTIISVDNVAEVNEQVSEPLRQGKYIVCNDMKNRHRVKPLTEGVNEPGYHSALALPIIQSGNVVGAFSFYAREKNFFDAEEITSSQKVVGNLSFALENFEKEASRKKADTGLAKANKRLLAAQEIAQNGYWEIDLVDGQLYWSDELYKIFETRYPHFFFDVSTNEEFVHPQDRQLLLETYKVMVEHETPLDVEYRFISKDESIKHLCCKGKLIKGDDGSARRIEGTMQDITDHKKAEQRIRTSEKRLLKAQEIGKFGYWIQELNTDIVWASKEAMRIYGFPAMDGELHRAEIAACIIDLQEVKTAAANLIEHNTEYNIEIRINPADGSAIKYISALAELEKNAAGVPVRIVGTLQDISQRKKAEEAMKENDQKLELIYNNTNDVLFLLSVKEQEYFFTSVNKGFQTTIGLTEDQIIGKSIGDIIPEPSLSFVLKNYQAAITGRQTIQWESTPAFPSGIKTVIVSVTPVFDVQGNCTMLVGTMHDITNRKKAEKEISDYKNALDQSSIISITDKKGIIKHVNENFCLTSGYSAEELIGKDHLIINSGHHSKSFMKELWDTIETGEIWRGELQNKAKDGHLFWVHTTIVPFLDVNGVPYQYLAIRVDITQRKLAEEEIRRSAGQLRQLAIHLQSIREEERKRIGREIHDELGQQLTAIHMGLAWIDKQIPESTLLIKEKLGNMIQLLHGTNQSISRILSELRPIFLDVHGLLEAIRWLGRQFTDSTGIPIKILIPEVDISASEQVINCIFRACQEAYTNITRYAHAHEVITSLSIAGNNVFIKIEDDGIGFNTTVVQNEKSFGILGMKERVISLGGVFEIESSPGRGTKIMLSLPLKTN